MTPKLEITESEDYTELTASRNLKSESQEK